MIERHINTPQTQKISPPVVMNKYERNGNCSLDFYCCSTLESKGYTRPSGLETITTQVHSLPMVTGR